MNQNYKIGDFKHFDAPVGLFNDDSFSERLESAEISSSLDKFMKHIIDSMPRLLAAYEAEIIA